MTDNNMTKGRDLRKNGSDNNVEDKNITRGKAELFNCFVFSRSREMG